MEVMLLDRIDLSCEHIVDLPGVSAHCATSLQILRYISISVCDEVRLIRELRRSRVLYDI